MANTYTYGSARPAGTARSAAPALALAAGSAGVVEVEEDGAVALGAPGVLPRQHHVHHAPGAPRQDHRQAADDAVLRAALRRHARARRRRRRGRRRREPPRRPTAAHHGVR
jgi:hypothetical protein